MFKLEINIFIALHVVIINIKRFVSIYPINVVKNVDPYNFKIL